MRCPLSPTWIVTSLQYFMSTKKLSRRQARWAEILSQYDFVISYRPGAANGKADAISRVNEDAQRRKEDPHLQQTLLPAEMLSEEVKKSLKTPPPVARLTAGMEDTTLYERVICAQTESALFTELKAQLANEEEVTVLSDFEFEKCAVKEDTGVLLYEGVTAVPPEAVLTVIQTVHDGSEVGHAGTKKTTVAIRRRYNWPQLQQDVKRYIRNCHTCRRVKPSNQKPAGVLQPLPIPDQPWADISMDFVTGIPKSTGMYGVEYNAILNVVDRLSKERHHIPCRATENGTTAEQTAQLLLESVWRYHGLPTTIVSDRGPQFASGVWKHLCNHLGVKAKLSTAFHPQSDGQTEAINKEMERYLRTFCNHFKNDWARLLPMAEFAGNCSTSEATTLAPFEVTKGFMPRMSFDTPTAREEQSDGPKLPAPPERERAQCNTAQNIASRLKDAWETAKHGIDRAQQKMAAAANKGRKDTEFNIGSKIWLSTKNLAGYRDKLSHKWAGPFEVLERHGSAYKLQLPESMAMHDTFHASLLSADPEDPLPGQQFPEPPPEPILGEDEWEVEEVLDIRKVKGRWKARIKWKGYDKDLQWYPFENLENSPEAVEDFFRMHPHKPRPMAGRIIEEV